jgi:hypothetical protein
MTFEAKIHKAIFELYPNIPIKDKVTLINKIKSFSKKKNDFLNIREIITMMIAAHVRHNYTDYDKLVNPENKNILRKEYSSIVAKIINSWR